jgi:hypothetical protein
VVRRLLDCALAVVIGSLILASPGLSAPPIRKCPDPMAKRCITFASPEKSAKTRPPGMSSKTAANPGSPYAGQAKRRALQLRQAKVPKRKAPVAVRETPQAEDPVGERPTPAPAPSAAVRSRWKLPDLSRRGFSYAQSQEMPVSITGKIDRVEVVTPVQRRRALVGGRRGSCRRLTRRAKAMLAAAFDTDTLALLQRH